MKPKNAPLAPLLLTVFLDLLGFGLIIPLLPFVAEDTGATPLMVTALLASYSLMQFVMAPFWGRLSDRIGRRPVLLISIAGSAVGLVIFGLSSSYFLLLISRLVHGGMNANIAVAQAYISDITTRETRAKGMGMFGAALGLGFTFGPALGGLLGPVAAFVAAGLAAFNFILAYLRLPETARLTAPARAWRVLDVAALRTAFASPALGPLLAVGLLFMMGFSAMESTFALWAERAYGWGARETGLIFTFIGVVLVITQGGLVGPLKNRFGERTLVFAGLGGVGIGLGGLAFATVLPSLLIVCGLLAFANGILSPSLSALVSFEGAASEQGGVLGLFQSMSALGRVLGPLMGGAVFTVLPLGASFVAGAVLSALCLAILVGSRGAASRDAAPVADGSP